VKHKTLIFVRLIIWKVFVWCYSSISLTESSMLKNYGKSQLVVRWVNLSNNQVHCSEAYPAVLGVSFQ